MEEAFVKQNKSCIAVWRVTHLFNSALLTAPSLWSACLDKLFPACILHCAKIHYKLMYVVVVYVCIRFTANWIFWCFVSKPNLRGSSKLNPGFFDAVLQIRKKSAVCKTGLVLVPTEPSGQSHSEFSHIDLLNFSPIDLSFPYRSSFNMCNRRPKYSEV